MTTVVAAIPTMGHTIKGLTVSVDSTTGVKTVSAASVADSTITDVLLSPITRVTSPTDAVGVGSTVAQGLSLAVAAGAIPALQAFGVVPVIMTDSTARATAAKLAIRLNGDKQLAKIANEQE